MFEGDVFHRFLNLPVRERVDPVLIRLAGLLPGDGQTVYCLLQLAIFALGSFMLFGRMGKRAYEASASTTIVLLAVLSVTPLDPFSLKFHWFPFLVLALDISRGQRNFVCDKGILKFWLVPVSLFMWWFTAGSVGVLGALLAPLIQAALLGEPDSEQSSRLYPYVVVLSIAGSLALMPIYQMPQFPGDARLAPTSPLTLLGHPTLGPDIHPLPVLYQNYLSQLSFASLRLDSLLLGLFALLLIFSIVPRVFGIFPTSRRIKVGNTILNSGDWSRLLALPILILMVTAALSNPGVIVGRHLPNLFPILRDLIPGLALEPLPWLLIPFGAISAALILAANCQRNHRMPVLLTLVVTATVSAYSNSPFDSAIAENYFRSPGTKRGALTAFDQDPHRASPNPSNYVARIYGAWIYHDFSPRKREASLRRYLIGTDVQVTASASIHPEDAHLALDKNYQTRWATKRPQQAGDWISFSFDRSLPVSRATLSIRLTPSDFPRGLKVEGTSDGSNYFSIYDFPDWLGPVEWTENGDPFFGLQARVIVEMPAAVELKGLRFTQTGSDPSFDWSVGELLLSGPTSEPSKPVDEDSVPDAESSGQT